MSHTAADVVLPPSREPGARTTALDVVVTLLERLEREHVAYCHWKSNEHVDAGVAGDTDLDLLVDRRAAPTLTVALLDGGFKRFAAHPDRSYAGVEDYLGLDRDTGRLVHLHVHYQLTLGERHLKGYRIPWEPLVLSTRRLDDSRTIYVADPHLELLLLVIRAALKLRMRDRLRPEPRVDSAAGGTAVEFRWLVERIEPGRLYEVARPLVGADAARAVVAMCGSGVPGAPALRAFRRSVVPNLEEYRTFGALDARRRRWMREAKLRWASVRSRLLGPSLPSRRTLPTGGLIVALVGSDGSGKSTISSELTRWLSWKVDVVPIYFGSGDGPKSVSRRLLGGLHRVGAAWRRVRGGRAASTPANAASVMAPTSGGGLRGFLRTVRRAWWALSLAHEKHTRLTRARQARDLGAIVVCDRFPQAQVAGVNDGPLLCDWAEHGTPLQRAAARREQAVYQLLQQCQPDLVVKLHTSPEVAWRRKPETPMELLHRKHQVVRALSYPPSVHVVDVDADEPLARTLLAVKQVLWGHLG